MKARRTVSIILSVIPIAIFALGAAAAAVYGAWANAHGIWTEGGEWLILFAVVLPLDGILAIPLSIIALCLNRWEGLLFVKILSIVNLVLGVPLTIFGITLIANLIETSLAIS